jgi:autotransporter translocation and assembly factor TamB
VLVRACDFDRWTVIAITVSVTVVVVTVALGALLFWLRKRGTRCFSSVVDSVPATSRMFQLTIIDFREGSEALLVGTVRAGDERLG